MIPATVYDVLINIHTMEGHTRRISIVFTRDGLEKRELQGAFFQERFHELERRLQKDLPPIVEGRFGPHLVFEADDADLAEEEATDLAQLFEEILNFAAVCCRTFSANLPEAALMPATDEERFAAFLAA